MNSSIESDAAEHLLVFFDNEKEFGEVFKVEVQFFPVHSLGK
jgi:hypothetical protein